MCLNCKTTYSIQPYDIKCIFCGKDMDIDTDKIEKKYKLIKVYPGSPKLGSVITDTNPNNEAKDSWFDINWCKSNHNSFKLPLSLYPEKYPEFWELIEPVTTTEDGYLIKCVGDDPIFIVNKEIFTISEVPYYRIYFYNKTNKYVFFKLYESANSWVNSNKFKYSQNQIEKLKDRFRNDEFLPILNIINEWETQNQ